MFKIDTHKGDVTKMVIRENVKKRETRDKSVDMGVRRENIKR